MMKTSGTGSVRRLLWQMVGVASWVALLSPRTGVDAERDTLSANVLSKYWVDAGDVIEDLDQYKVLWIKFHGCV